MEVEVRLSRTPARYSREGGVDKMQVHIPVHID